MNFKIVFAAALMISGASFVATAQQKTTTATVASASAKTKFNTKIKAYEKATDPVVASSLLQEMKQDIMKLISDSKQAIGTAQSAGDMAASDVAMKKNQDQMEAFNKLIQADKGGNKSEVVTVLKSFAKEIK